jgi:hypothetical protein
LRYKRPDNGRQVYLSELPEDQAVALAMLLNDAFGPRPPNGMRHVYRQQFLSYPWGDATPALVELVAVKLPDALPMQRGLKAQEEIRHSWAFDVPSPAALRHGLRPLRAERREWIKPLFLAARKNAAARDLPFDLTLEDVERLVVESGGRCAVTGVTLSTDRGLLPEGRKMRRPWAPSLDRLDSAKGYAAGNCRIVCCAANFAMSQWGEEVLVEMAKAIARKRMARLDRVATG